MVENAAKFALNFTSCLLVNEGIVEQTSDMWLKDMEYEENEVNGLGIADVFRELIKTDISSIDFLNKESIHIIITKHQKIKLFNIRSYSEGLNDYVLYVFKERVDCKLQANLNVISQLISNSPFGMAIFSVPDIRLLGANQIFLDFLDEPFNKKENSIGKKIGEIITGWKGSSSEKIWSTALKTSEAYHIEEYRFDGFKRGATYWNASLTPIYEGDKLKYFVEITSEITESVLNRKAIEEQKNTILEQKRQLEAIVDNMSDGLFILDKDGRYIILNKEAKSYYSSEIDIKNLGDSFKAVKYLDEEGHEIPLEALPTAKVIRGETLRDIRLTIKSPEKSLHITTSGKPIYDDEGNLVMGIVCSRDISERVRYEKFVRSQYDNLYNIIHTLDLPIIRISYPDFKIIEINNKAYNEMHILGRCFNSKYEQIKLVDDVVEVFPNFHSGKNKECIIKMIHTKAPVYLPNLEVDNGGRKTYINAIYQPILNSQDVIEEFLVISIDVTREVEQKKAIENLAKIKDEFLYTITHEFKTPLVVISSAIQAMEVICKDELTENIMRFVSKIKQNTQRQMRLVNNLLDITRVESGHIRISKANMDIVTMARLITESVSMYADLKGIDLSFSSAVENKFIAIDEEKFERIMLNLLSNAIKFTPKGKSVRVEVSTQEGSVIVKVIDTGIGIPEDKVKTIFERFGQVDSSLSRKAEGTGIGLSLVSLLVNALGGQITVESKQNRGSTFTVIFPDVWINSVSEENSMIDLNDNRLIQAANIEFSDIYFD